MILVIDDNTKRKDTLCEIFHYMGILSFGTSAHKAYSELTDEYRAILVSEPNEMPDAREYLAELSKYAGKIPVFVLSDDPVPGCASISARFPSDIYSSELVNSIINYLDERSLPSLGKYLLAGLDAGCDIGEVRFMSEKMSFTKSEAMIIRYLIVSYPNPKSARDILLHTSKPGKLPDPSVIRTHISVINKKFKASRERNLIAQTECGYRIITPENPETN